MKGYVYIMASASGVLYVGVTSNLQRRVLEHKQGVIDGFTKKYRCHKLVYFEQGEFITAAITHEKEIKSWRRAKKLALIAKQNPEWIDLYEELFGSL
jgi:putative endonuclease